MDKYDKGYVSADIILLTPIVSRAKSKWYKPKKSQEIGIKFTTIDCSNLDNVQVIILCLSYFITTRTVKTHIFFF